MCTLKTDVFIIKKKLTVNFIGRERCLGCQDARPYDRGPVTPLGLHVGNFGGAGPSLPQKKYDERLSVRSEKKKEIL